MEGQSTIPSITSHDDFVFENCLWQYHCLNAFGGSLIFIPSLWNFSPKLVFIGWFRGSHFWSAFWNAFIVLQFRIFLSFLSLVLNLRSSNYTSTLSNLSLRCVWVLLICQFRYSFISGNFLNIYSNPFSAQLVRFSLLRARYLYVCSFLSCLSIYYFLCNCFDCLVFSSASL